MRKRWIFLSVTLLGGLLVGITVVAQSGRSAADRKGADVAKEDVETKTLVVKNYADMAELAVFRLSQNDKIEHVRFKAAFRELLRPKPGVLDVFRIGRARIDPILIFQTQGEIVGLIVRRDIDLLRRTLDLVPGQEIIIEGTVLPEYRGYKCVIVDDIKFSYYEKRDVQWQVVLDWPGESQKLIKMPGTYTLKLPVLNPNDKFVTFKIEVRRVRQYEIVPPAQK